MTGSPSSEDPTPGHIAPARGYVAKPVTAIVLGVDTPTGLTLVRELGGHGVQVIALGSGPEAIGLASRFAGVRQVREKNEADLCRQLVHLAAEHCARFLLTVSETDIDFVNRHRPLLQEHLCLLVPRPDVMAKVLNKDASIGAAKRLGIETPATVQVKSLQEGERIAGSIRYPVVLKWSNPHAVFDRLSREGLDLVKAEYAHDQAELVAVLSRYSPVGTFPLIQEYAPGYGMGQMFLFVNGQALLAFQHRRVHEFPPEGGISTICESVPLAEHADCRSRSVALLESLAWEGVAMVEYRHDPTTGRYVLMEINGRFWGSQPLAYHAGAHFAWAWVASQLGQSLPSAGYRGGIRCCYMVPEMRRLMRVFFERRKILIDAGRFGRTWSAAGLLRTLLTPGTCFYVFSLRDPRPFLADAISMLRKALRLLRRARR